MSEVVPHVTVPHPDDPWSMPVFEGPADQAHARLAPGSYPALSYGPPDAEGHVDLSAEPVAGTLRVWATAGADVGSDATASASVFDTRDQQRADT